MKRKQKKRNRHRQRGASWDVQHILLAGVLAMMAWGGNEMIGIKSAIGGMRDKQVLYDQTHTMAAKMHDAIIRIEVQQKKGLEEIKILREGERD